MTLKTAVIGVGALGRHHARILSELDGVELVGVVDQNREQGESVAAACETTWHADCDAIIDDVDAVSVVVPTVAHLAVASQVLERGISVLVEKPIASTVAEARQMVDLADANGCVLQVGHIERFNPAMQAVRNQLGTPKYIRAERVSPYTFRSTDISVVLDLMIHDIDLTLSLVDSPIASVEAFGTGVFGDLEDIAQARVRFENGCIADLTASRVNPTATRTMQVWSDLGCTNIDLGSREVSKFGAGPALLAGQQHRLKPKSIDERNELMKSVFGKFISETTVPVKNSDALTAELLEFTDCVRTRQSPTVSGQEGLAAIEAADLILQSIADHGWGESPAGRTGVPAHIRAA
ncbi:MAG: Gfo/Idh/MocA family oxidoreductase [Planctomycetaceae bacterium]